VDLPEKWLIFVQETLGLSLQEDLKLIPLGARGSDRAYYRITWGMANSAILAHYQSVRIENTYFGDIAAFLLEIGIRAPKILRHDKDSGLLLQEDLGGIDLVTFREAPWEIRKDLYQKTLAMAHTLHSYPIHDFPANRIKLMESFSPSLYRWERDYFRTNFVANLCGIRLDVKTEESLEKELSQLAERLTRYPDSLVHRDLQAPNIMIRDGMPYMIDFQGMRFGNRFYDLGSLLCDPHARFQHSERLELLNIYYELSPPHGDLDNYMRFFWEASAQRLMQALGAYGFLGLTRGLTDYFKQIPAGLRNLRLAAEQGASLPQLLEICHQCENALGNSPNKAIGSLMSCAL
jgi:N-acetylmuramate 1-kinase